MYSTLSVDSGCAIWNEDGDSHRKEWEGIQIHITPSALSANSHPYLSAHLICIPNSHNYFIYYIYIPSSHIYDLGAGILIKYVIR